MNSIKSSWTPVIPSKRWPKLKPSRLPSINKREQNVRSPIHIAQYRKRAMSPIQTQNISTKNWIADQNFNRSDIPSPTHKYTIEWTHEQSIINEKVRVRVQEAKLLRFTGFKSPRALILKILDNHNIWNKYELGFNNFSNEVHAPICNFENHNNSNLN